MLSAPVKSAKRISSLFSLNSNADDLPLKNQHPSPPQRSQSANRLSKASSSRASAHHHHHQHVSGSPSQSPLRHPVYSVASESVERFDLLDGLLPPPPALTDVNQDLATSSFGPSERRSGSRSRSASRPSSSGGLSMSDQRRSRTPTSMRRSWMPGWSRPESAVEPKTPVPNAWIAGLDQKVPYDLEPLSRGDKVRRTGRSKHKHY